MKITGLSTAEIQAYASELLQSQEKKDLSKDELNVILESLKLSEGEEALYEIEDEDALTMFDFLDTEENTAATSTKLLLNWIKEKFSGKSDATKTGSSSSAANNSISGQVYDNAGKLVSYTQTNKDGSTVKYSDIKYDAQGKRTGQKVQYYDSKGSLTKSQDVTAMDTNGRATAYKEYNAQGNLTADLVNIQYDSAGKVSSYTSKDLDGSYRNTSNITYDAQGKRTGQKVQFYDSKGSLTRTRECTAMDSSGRPTAYKDKDANGNVISECSDIKHDSSGNVSSYTKKNPDGTSTKFSEMKYDSSGKIVSYTELKPNGTTEKYSDITYDSAGNRASFNITNVNGLNKFSEVKYDSSGKIIGYTHNKPNGATDTVSGIKYNTLGQRTEYTVTTNNFSTKISNVTYDSSGNIASYTSTNHYGVSTDVSECKYDSSGRRTGHTAKTNNVTVSMSGFTYDNVGNLTSSKKTNKDGSYSDDTDCKYDKKGNKTSQTTNYYDAKKNLLKTLKYLAYNLAGLATSWKEYDSKNNLTVDFSDVKYDSSGKIESYTSKKADGSYEKISNIKYDSEGNKTSQVVESYDKDGKLISKKTVDL